jgi:hypothetical protein
LATRLDKVKVVVDRAVLEQHGREWKGGGTKEALEVFGLFEPIVPAVVFFYVD